MTLNELRGIRDQQAKAVTTEEQEDSIARLNEFIKAGTIADFTDAQLTEWATKTGFTVDELKGFRKLAKKETAQQTKDVARQRLDDLIKSGGIRVLGGDALRK